MKSPFGFRLWVLIVALISVASGTIYGLSAVSQRVQRLEAKLSRAQIESFRLANDIERRLLDLNNSMLRYSMLRQDREWQEFQRASTNLNHTLDRYDPSVNRNSPLTTDAERSLLRELNRAYDDYLSTAVLIHSNARPPLVTREQFQQLHAFDAQSERMRGLAQALADAHRSAETGFLETANAALAHLRLFLTISVVLLLTMFGALAFVIYRDLIAPLRTRLVQSQQLLERQEKLATLGTLAAGIAHEIRNPLTSLKARLYTLQKHLEATPAARKDTEIISAEVSRLERIVQDVLGFARPAEPKMDLICTEDLLREVKGLMAPNLESRGIHLESEVGPRLFIRGDSAHLKQVLINLVRNGADAIEDVGTVTLRSRASRVRIDRHDTDAVVLEVIDTGKGIPPEAERRLFDPFFSTKENGTGLGLSIAARIVERHNGALQYQTQPGHGTTFGVVLPRQMPESAAAASLVNEAGSI